MTEMVLVPHELEGHVVQQRRSDGYINATQLCRAAGKEWKNYWQNATTKEFVDALSRSAGIPADELVESRSGNGGGTWVHPKIAINLAQWCSPHFAVQVTDWVFELMTAGKVELISSTGNQNLDNALALQRQTELLVSVCREQARVGVRLDTLDSRITSFNSRINDLESKTDDVKEAVEAASLSADAALKRADGNHGYVSILGHYKRYNREVSTPVASAHGKVLVRICADRGLPVQKVHDGRFNTVNLYPESVLKEYFDVVRANGKV